MVTTNPILRSVLSQLGLTEPEVRVFLASMELGPQPASVLAKHADLKRGHTYNVLALLISKGIVQEFTKGNVRCFSSQSPKTLLGMVKRQKDELELQEQKLLHVIPLLERLQNPLLQQPTVRFFQGVNGIKEMYEETLENPDETIFALGDFAYIFPETKDERQYEWIWQYAERRAAKGIRYLGIANKSAESDLAYRKRIAHKRKLKMLRDTYLPVEINIYGTKVAIMSTHIDQVGVVIDDASIAETLRNFHKSVWPLLPDYK